MTPPDENAISSASPANPPESPPPLLPDAPVAHISVLLQPTVDALMDGPLGISDIGPRIFVDATFGRGGHSRALLARLGPQDRLIAFDKDPAAQAEGARLHQQDSRLTMVHASFAELSSQLAALGIAGVHGIMADLGVSSPQLDEAGRGFSFMLDGPLDMRMDCSQGLTAAKWLEHVSEVALADVLFEYGEERYSRRIAKAIKHALPLTTTLQLAEVIRAAHPRWEKNKHPATRSFQAIRIAINRELADLDSFLQQTPAQLLPGARLAVISFHSLEDRRVKQFIQLQAQPPANDHPFAVTQTTQKTLRKVARIAPDALEIQHNPRSRSAWLRVAERV